MTWQALDVLLLILGAYVVLMLFLTLYIQWRK